MYEHTWGRGTTPQEAKARARAAGGRGERWVTYCLPEGAEMESAMVDDFGNVRWSGAAGRLEVVAKGRGIRGLGGHQ